MRTIVENLERVTFDRDIMQGQACLRGMRIPVSLVVNLIARGKSAAEIIEEYPALEPEDIAQSLKYAALLIRDEALVDAYG